MRSGISTSTGGLPPSRVNPNGGGPSRLARASLGCVALALPLGHPAADQVPQPRRYGAAVPMTWISRMAPAGASDPTRM
jgi:hypothetical protein